MTKTKRGTTKHTPGPWAIWTSCSYRRIGSEATGREVAYPTTQRDGHPDIEFPNGGADGPDARLIAAAPDLLEAVKLALTFQREGCPDPKCNVCQRNAEERQVLLNAVAKAEGQ